MTRTPTATSNGVTHIIRSRTPNKLSYPLTWRVTTYCDHTLEQTGISNQVINGSSHMCEHCRAAHARTMEHQHALTPS